ncbi:Sec7 domain protein [Aspergillus clavatus NRRL 1]|uniref:Sec7 domain protein n=1 Tax=Aspergillus clavatus (strain ATCC 1007 / CBS 513.65 / DSM 816 / NCTC 3887 / NRRL 1 / QM 1276 / 107) TaxID=344612 RepID=A1CJ43_ASPCL|nr:Sec7 domain protein [Aspergillus clavatus NRRL 1]EAW09167.1 Sec7 domain protein [Aspergillus clavatus NRRL 1]
MPSGQDTQANRSPPRTPPSQASNYKPTKRGLHPRPSLRETFLDDMNPADNANSGNESSDERDPHDLSLSPKHAARTSIVDNMLLSLDQFAFSAGNSILDDYRLFNSVFESELYGRNSQESTTQQRYRGHTFSSSLSSEADLGYDDSAARYGTQPARGRRSNSSSNYHSGLRRIGSTRSRDAPGSRGQLYDYRTVAGGDPSAMRTTRKSSKASASSTLDFGPPLIRAQAGSTNERRSASFDYGTRPTLTSTDFESTFYDSTDAAPTPSVPAGPRKLHSSSQNDYSGPSNSQSSRTPVVSRRNSPKSSRTNQARKSRPENINSGANMRGADSGMRNLADDGLDPPPNISATLDPPAPSPTISFNKPTLLPPPEPAPVKERPGFFRRVFGSSRSSVIVPAEASHYDSPISLEHDTNQVNAASGTLRGSRQPQRNHNVSGASTPRERPPQVVNKKPSFFRRRKKSISIDNSAPPPIVLPQQLGPRTMEILKPEPSPVSSLRKVMNPYLADGVGPACDKSKERPARAAVADDAANKTAGLSSAQRGKEQVSAAPVKGVSKSKYSLYPPPPAGSGHDTSFLMNSSGNEESTVKAAGLDSEASVDPPQRKMAVRDGIESQDNEQVGQVASESQHTITPPTMIPAPALSPVVQNLSPASATAQDDGSKETTTEDKVHPEETAEGVLRSNSGVGGDRRTAQLSKLTIPATETAGVSPHTSPSDTEFFTAANTPAVPSEDPEIPEDITERPDSASSSDEPTSSDREHARRLFDSQDQVVGNEPAAAWLGDPNRATIREAYMELFNWSNMNILAALRSLCTRLILKGETQQVDRVLDAFSTRWCQCNPRHGFKASGLFSALVLLSPWHLIVPNSCLDVVHTICYSLLLLNTDLHLADIEQKMTKTQFVRNTMPTIHRVAIDAAPDSFDPLRPANRARLSAIDSNSQPTSADESERANGDVNRPTNPPPKLSNRLSRTDLSIKLGGDPDSDIGPLVNAPFNGSVRAWEQQVETVLRDFYSSIQKQKLPLHGASGDRDGHQPQSNSLLGPGSNHHGLRRSPSTISKSGSDIYPRGRSADSRYGTARWSSKPRSRARLCPPSTMGSSRTSLDDQSSLWSPSASSTWSKYSLGKLTSASVDSFGSDYPRGDYQQSIGFANALSQAIIREDTAHSIASSEDVEGTVHLLEDETLQLAGAPWAKEGSLKHKHHLDSVDKRAKDRNWNECFAVIQQGWMRLFSFSSSAKSVRPKPKPRSPGGLVVGGGNWTENAEEIWKFLLRQSIASALPPPGYSKSRPHVWALSLPTGAVHLFQAGTPEIVREFVSTANYWSARLSKEPLIGGISNMEFGWSDAVINSALVNTDHNKTPPSSSGARPSIQSSIRSSIDQQGVRPRLPADRVHIGDWAPPQQSMVASGQPEVDQLKALQTYVKNVEEELQRHNELRPAMILAFSPRHPNAIKAMANWERKSSYLLREIVKFRTYIDSLQGAIDARNQIYASREDETPERAED